MFSRKKKPPIVSKPPKNVQASNHPSSPEAEINKKKSENMSSNSGEVSSFVDSIRDKKAALLNKLNSSNSQMTKSSSSSRTLHTVSSQEENRTSNFSRSISLSSDASQVRMSSNSGQRKYSIDSLDNKTEEPVPIVTEPDSPQSGITSPNFEGQSPKTQPKMVVNNGQMVASNKSKLQTNDANYEKVTSMSKETKRLQSVDRTIEEKRRAAEFKQKLETDNVKAEKKGIISQEKKQLISSDIFKQSQKSASAASANVQIHSSKDEYSAKKMAVSQQEERQMISSTQGITHEKHVASASSSKMTFMSKSASTSNSSLASHNLKNLENAAASVASGLSMLNGSLMEGFAIGSPTKLSITNESPEDELDRINSFSESDEVNLALARCTRRMASCVEKLKTASDAESIPILDNMSELILRAWAVHTHGHDLGYSLCNVLRNNGGLDILMRNCSSDNTELQFSSARVLEQCLTTENRAHVVENGLDKVVRAACNANRRNIVTHSRVGSGILEHLFKHSESACGEVIQLGGLDAILYECRSSDIETLRHCAAALANLSLYGGGDNQQSMIKSKVPVWLFPLAFHNDDNIKYYACMAIAALVANKEVEAAVIRSGTLNLVEPFVTSHNPKEFAASSASHVHGQSKNWLQRLVHVLKSKREEARNLAAFHFAMEAGIKRKQGNTKFFHEIGAVDALKKVASSPNAIASKYAAHALRLIGEEVPHKLSQQVPLWTVEDVTEWVKQIGFGHHSTDFLNSRVDGDLLLQMEEENLCDDIGIRNGILRRRFMRELNELKKMSDYSSCDPENLYLRLQNIYPELCKYAYTMIKSGVSSDNIMQLNDDQLRKECGIDNSIHRIKVLDSIRGVSQSYGNITNDQDTSNVNKNLDVFISYRRSNGSQLASLLKVHLQLRGFSVFIDVERLEAGKFDNNLLQSVRQAKHFILVLTPNALDRCIGDDDTKDWVHREIYAALQSKCNIIPIIDNFQWPESEKLPDDIRAVCYFNGVRWIHDYQDACVDKLERFMRGEMNSKSDGHGRYAGAMTPSTPSSTLGNRGHAGLFQRSTSNENNSDKDSNGSHATPSHH